MAKNSFVVEVTFNVIVAVTMSYILIILVELCMNNTFCDLEPCNIEIESYTNFKIKFVQRNMMN